mgnify:CR=1 FL=1
MSDKLKIGIIGLGHWGPNLLSNFLANDLVDVAAVCDMDSNKLAKAKSATCKKTSDATELLTQDNDIRAIIVATPVSTHYGLVKQALESGKDVFVEKPLASTVEEATELVELAKAKNLILMVGHVFLYNRGIQYVKGLIDAGELGDLQFIHCERTNLGPFRHDVDAFQDLATHDISILNYWLDGQAKTISAHGGCFLGNPRADVVSANLTYPNGVHANILVSWLHPRKTRQITVVGSRKMLEWNDMSSTEPIRIYDKHTEVDYDQKEGSFAEFHFTIHEGNVLIPRVAMAQPLREECHAFVDAVLTRKPPFSDGDMGVAVMQCLQAAATSMATNSAHVQVK